jgi:hypothetical protein
MSLKVTFTFYFKFFYHRFQHGGSVHFLNMSKTSATQWRNPNTLFSVLCLLKYEIQFKRFSSKMKQCQHGEQAKYFSLQMNL